MPENPSPNFVASYTWVNGVFRPLLNPNPKYKLPLYLVRVSAGYPSPADDHLDRTLDLNELLIDHPSATVFVYVSGDSMIKACVHHNDLLIVDHSLEPRDGKIVIVSLNGDMLVKRLRMTGKRLLLVAESDDYPVVEVHEEMELLVWGVVTTIIHRV